MQRWSVKALSVWNHQTTGKPLSIPIVLAVIVYHRNSGITSTADWHANKIQIIHITIYILLSIECTHLAKTYQCCQYLLFAHFWTLRNMQVDFGYLSLWGTCNAILLCRVQKKEFTSVGKSNVYVCLCIVYPCVCVYVVFVRVCLCGCTIVCLEAEPPNQFIQESIRIKGEAVSLYGERSTPISTSQKWLRWRASAGAQARKMNSKSIFCDMSSLV